MNEQNPNPFEQFYVPPPPPVFHGDNILDSERTARCIKCSGQQDVSAKSFKKAHIPPVAFLALLFGPLIGAIVLLIARVRHDVTLSFCGDCWKKFKRSEWLETLSALGFFVSVILGVVMLLNFESGLAFFVFPLISLGVIVWVQIYKHRNSPKFKKVDRKQAVVSAGPYGDLVFSKTATSFTNATR